MRKVRILIISPVALFQVIEQVLGGRPQFAIVGRLASFRSLTRTARKLLPDLIVASVKPVGTAVCHAVITIKHSSPLSKLILLCPVRDLARRALVCGADACLEQEKLLLRLFPIARALAERPALSKT